MARPKKAPARYDFERMLRESIESRQMTIYAIAAESGVASSVISRFLSGKQGITSGSFARIAEALNIRYAEAGGARPARAKARG